MTSGISASSMARAVGPAASVSSRAHSGWIAARAGQRVGLRLLRQLAGGADGVLVDALGGEQVAGQLLCAGEGAVGDGEPRGSRAQQRARGQLGRLARADQQHALALEAGEDVARQLDGHLRHAGRALAQLRLGAHALTHAQRPVHQPVEEEPRRARLNGQTVCGAHLAEYLVLPHHLRLQPRRHAEEVLDGLLPVVAEQGRGVLQRLGALEACDVGEHVLDGVLPLAGDVVDLRAVAGVQHQGLLEDLLLPDGLQELRHQPAGEGDLLPHVHGGGVMIDADDGDVHCHAYDSSMLPTRTIMMTRKP